jgi:hypothetical protein
MELQLENYLGMEKGKSQADVAFYKWTDFPNARIIHCTDKTVAVYLFIN